MTNDDAVITCKQGGRHRWDERRDRCLDCGRGAATIAEELKDWLAEAVTWSFGLSVEEYGPATET